MQRLVTLQAKDFESFYHIYKYELKSKVNQERNLIAESLVEHPNQGKMSYQAFFETVSTVCNLENFMVFRNNPSILGKKKFADWPQVLVSLLVNQKVGEIESTQKFIDTLAEKYGHVDG